MNGENWCEKDRIEQDDELIYLLTETEIRKCLQFSYLVTSAACARLFSIAWSELGTRIGLFERLAELTCRLWRRPDTTRQSTCCSYTNQSALSA